MNEKRTKLTGIRKIIGEKMKQSLLDNPHVSGYVKVDMSDILKLKEEFKDNNKKISMTAFIIKAIAVAMEKFPELNARLEENEIITYEDVNVGVGVAAPNGLFIVVVKEAQLKSLEQISEELSLLIEKAKTGRITMDEMTGSTITISNLSMTRIEAFFPIINNNECLIIGIGGIKKELVVNDDDTTSIRQMGTISCNVNHAITDGFPGTMFTCEVVANLENPYEKLL